MIIIDRELNRLENEKPSINDSNHVQSIVQAKDSLVKLLYKDNESDLISLESEEVRKRAKKIEFSQSIKIEKPERELPFTHAKLDKIVLDDASQEFDIAKAKKLLK